MARYGLQSQAFRDAVTGLVIEYLGRYKREDKGLVEKMAHQLLSEYIAQFCVACRGTGEVMHNDLKTRCSVCWSSGVRKYTDEERARMMQISYARIKQMRFKFQWLYDYISSADRRVNDVMVRELEREP